MNDIPTQPFSTGLVNEKLDKLIKIAERMAPCPLPPNDLDLAQAFVWHGNTGLLQPVGHINRVDLTLLKAIDSIRDILVDNTRRFALGLAANNALLWGARGMGKSSLIKATHGFIHKHHSQNLKLIEIHREEISSLPALLNELRGKPQRAILFCDDLSFDQDDTSYKSLKAALDGGVEGRPENVLFYATSNRRHLLPRDMIENERSTAINPAESAEEKISLSDRFGLWLGFHKCRQEDYLEMINAYATHYKLEIGKDALQKKALEWSMGRGARSGRVAWQFIQDLSGRLGKSGHL